MGSGNLHVPVCNSSTAFSESFCGQPEDSAAEMTDVLFFLSSDAAALGLWPSSQGPQACRRTHQAHQCWGTQGALGLVSCLHKNVMKLPPVSLQWQLWCREHSAMSSARKLPAPSNLNSFLHPRKTQDGFSLSSPCPLLQIFTVSFMIVIFPENYSFFFGGGWHIHPGNRKISECSVKISIVCLFLSLTCMKEIVTLPGISL